MGAVAPRGARRQAHEGALQASLPTHKASSTNRRTWSTFEQAVAALERGDGDGIGFVFAADDEFVGCDLDHCREAETGALAPVAVGIAGAFATYQEASQSGTGVHLIMTGHKPQGAGCKRPLEDIEVEVYESGRYFCMTGARLGEVATVCDCQAALDDLCYLVWPPKASADNPPRATGAERLDDRELVAKMLAATNGHNLAALYNGDTAAFGDDHSSADAALLTHLAWWTNRDAEQMDRLFRTSGLTREKLERADYRQRSIAFAIEANGSAGYSATPPGGQCDPQAQHDDRADPGDPQADQGAADDQEATEVPAPSAVAPTPATPSASSPTVVIACASAPSTAAGAFSTGCAGSTTKRCT